MGRGSACGSTCAHAAAVRYGPLDVPRGGPSGGHTVESPLNQALVESRGTAPIHQGITEVWWDSMEELEAAVATPEGAAAGARLVEDEAKFIDFSRSTIFITEEHTIFDR
jgi:EthD domain